MTTGWLSGKGYRDDAPGGGDEILIEKTNASSDIIWDTVLGACNKTASCNNDLIGMHESGDGYDIIYQSYPQQSNESCTCGYDLCKAGLIGPYRPAGENFRSIRETCLDFCKWWQQGRF